MRRLVWGLAGRTYHIVGNLMSRLKYKWWSTDLKFLKPARLWKAEKHSLDFKKTLFITILPLNRCILLHFGLMFYLIEPAHGILALIAYVSREGSDEPLQMCSLARAYTARIKQSCDVDEVL